MGETDGTPVWETAKYGGLIVIVQKRIPAGSQEQPNGTWIELEGWKWRWHAKSTPKRRRIYKRDGGKCRYCEFAADIHYFHLDHIIPKSKGGNSHADNLTLACPECNMRKGNKL